MSAGHKFPALDYFRFAAALLVIAIHTSPLASFSPEGDFWLTRVLARLAVPFFMMVTGYFLSRDCWKSTGSFLKKTALLYAAAMLLYLPLNFLNGGYQPLEWLRRIFFSGTFYHLWYFPALLLGVVIARLLSRLGTRWALVIAALLYLAGLFGDSYYGSITAIPVFHDFYEFIFSLFGYTRNGVFFAPLFLLLGSCCRTFRLKRPVSLFLCAFAGMSAEAFLVRGLSWQRHDSMYLLLPFCMAGLFSFLLSRNRGRSRSARRVSLLIYLLHPLCIVLVRGGAKLLHLETVFIENSLGHFAAVCLFSFGLSFALSKIDFHKGAAASRAWREIDEAALCANASLLRQAAQCPLMAVVKADAYGHGAKIVARALQKNGVHFFAVACLSEGISLRKAGIRGNILVLGYTAPDAAPLLRRWRLMQTVTCLSYARELSGRQRALRVHLALDTGMHRLGVDCHDLKAITEIYRLPHLKIKGVFSHLCASDGVTASEKAYTEMQLKNFYSAVEAMRQNGLDPGVVHIQASYGILSLPPQPCGLARSGIALYGLTSDGRPYRRASSLKPVLAVRARVAAVRTLQAGERVGYGLAFTALRPTRLAVVAMGYADGLPRDFAAKGGEILLNGKKAPVVGLLCMDQLFADVTEIGPVACGDIATLIGNDQEGQLLAQDVALQCGMITNQLISRLNARLPAVKAASKILP